MTLQRARGGKGNGERAGACTCGSVMQPCARQEPASRWWIRGVPWCQAQAASPIAEAPPMMSTLRRCCRGSAAMWSEAVARGNVDLAGRGACTAVKQASLQWQQLAMLQ